MKDTLVQEVKKNNLIISSEEIRNLVNKEYKNYQVVCLDRKYRSIPFDLAKKLIKEDKTDRIRYEAEFWDCDNHARLFAVNMMKKGWTTVGVVLDLPGKHCYDMLINFDNNGEINIRLFEPQSDSYPKTGQKLSGTEAYTNGPGYILF